MTAKTLDQHIETRPDIARGKPRIAGHRITVRDIVIWHERLGKGVDEIASDYGLTLADVHAALAYYFDHRADIDRGMADGQAFADSLRHATPFKLKHKLNVGKN
jgi:uncharacterized protein (DUF433 family)